EHRCITHQPAKDRVSKRQEFGTWPPAPRHVWPEGWVERRRRRVVLSRCPQKPLPALRRAAFFHQSRPRWLCRRLRFVRETVLKRDQAHWQAPLFDAWTGTSLESVLRFFRRVPRSPRTSC